MKKTVQIVTMPLGESSKLAKKDTSDKYELAEGETVFVNGIGYTPQQLLILSDDDVQVGDVYEYHGSVAKYESDTHAKHPHFRNVIASYPQLEGTLPISKETVQDWIDAGTPGEGAIHEEIYMTSKNLSVDSQGNLLLEFAQPFKSTMPIFTVPSIPTDEEIEERSEKWVDMNIICSDNKSGTQVRTSCELSYIAGYKQALKDLGHEM